MNIISIFSLIVIVFFFIIFLISTAFIIVFFIPGKISIYRIPMFLYIFSFFPIYFLVSLIDYFYSGFSNLLLYFICMLLYSFIMLFSLYIKTRSEDDFILKEDGSTFIRIINQHENYFKTFFLPFSFLILVVGFVASIFVFLKDIPQPQVKPAVLVEWLFSIPNVSSVYNAFPVLGKLILLITLFSLPMQVIAYFFVKVIQYFYKYGEYYLNFLRKILKYLLKLKP